MRQMELPSPLDLETAGDVLGELWKDANGSFLRCWCDSVPSHCQDLAELLKKSMWAWVTGELYQPVHLDSQLGCSHLVGKPAPVLLLEVAPSSSPTC